MKTKASKVYNKGEKIRTCVFIEEISVEEKQNRKAIFKCRCDNNFVAEITKVYHSQIVSCGCSSVKGNNMTTHGLSHTKEYGVWLGIKNRCNNPNHHKYYTYGARGIKMDIEWENDFTSFIRDMGMRPFSNSSIERLDNEKGYCKENCIWGNPIIQARNTTRSRMLTYNNETRCASEWEELLGIPSSVIRSRIKKGWSVEDALSTPNKPPKQKNVLYKDKVLGLFDWSKILKIPYRVLTKRLKEGWDIDSAFETPYV